MSLKIEAPPKDELISLYSNNSISELARSFNTSNPTVRKWLKEYGIKLKNHKTASQEANAKTIGTNKLPKDILDKLSNRDWLYEQRITLRKSKETIAESLGISITPVNKYLSKFKIPEMMYNQSNPDVRFNLESKSYLEDLYLKNELTIKDIAEKLGSSSATVSIFLAKHGIETRDVNSYERKASFRSKAEIEICQYLDSINISYKTNVRINGHEIDIFIESHNFAIEFNGIYWHTDKFKDKNSHRNKTYSCRDNGIFLLHIWEDVWRSNRDLILSMIDNKLGRSIHIGARKCEIRLVHETNKIQEFLNLNHVQGYCSAQIYVGIFHKEELIGLLTVSRSRFDSGKYDWEIIRFAVKRGINIQGGFSKALKFFRTIYSGSIITYADLSYSYGNLYIKNGFTHIRTNPPSYWYVTGNPPKRVSRTRFMKSKMKDFDQSLTEKEIVDILGIPRIWNCGTLTFVLN